MTVGPLAYTTYFDQRYLAIATVMLRSLRRHDPSAFVFALCLDQTSAEAISALADDHIVVVTAEALAEYEPRVDACRGRTRHAFYCTLKPIIASFAFSRRPDLTAIASIDA